MRKLMVMLVIAMVAIFIVGPKFVKWTATNAKTPGGTAGLRLAVLEHKLNDSSAVADSNDVTCVVMDWNMGGRNNATLLAFADGRTSVYLSPGTVINGGDRESVRAFAERFRTVAEEKNNGGWFGQTADFDLPTNGHMRFYIVTRTRTIATRAEQSVVLANKTQFLNALAEAGQATIGELQHQP